MTWTLVSNGSARAEARALQLYGAPGLQPRGLGLLLAATLAITVAAESRQDTRVEIAVGGGKLAAQLSMPSAPTGRVPVVIVVTAGAEVAETVDLSSLSNRLAAEGIASLRYPAPFVTAPETSSPFETAVATVATTVSFLRNDIRFSTITIADASSSSIGAIAARVARADTSVVFSAADPSAVTKAVRDLELPGAPRPRRNTGQRASLRDTTLATIDGGRIAIEYGRPSRRGREIWGSLVKWDAWWMPGADEATTLTTNRDLTFETLAVPAGDYTLYTMPGEDTFSLIINRQTGQFHTVYNPDRDLGRVTMRRQSIEPFAERLTFFIYPRTEGGGELKLMWDWRAYNATFTVSKK